MPIFNLFKNCSYYYGFAAYVAYFVNHPQYTTPPETQSLVLFALALIFQLSNLRWGLVHVRVERFELRMNVFVCGRVNMCLWCVCVCVCVCV
jgi:hypothetical protein